MVMVNNNIQYNESKAETDFINTNQGEEEADEVEDELTRRRRLSRESTARYEQSRKNHDREAFLRKQRESTKRYRANMSEEKREAARAKDREAKRSEAARAKNREAKRRARMKKRQS